MGMLSALIVGPELVMPSEYLPEVWGDAPIWEDPEQAQQGLTVVMGMWNHIAWRVEQPIDPDADSDDQVMLLPPFGMPDPPEGTDQDEEAEDYDPLADVPDDFPFVAPWANGFLHGMSLRQAQWDAWLEQHDDLQEEVALLLVLAAVSPEQLHEMDIPAAQAMGLQQRVEAAMGVPDMLQQMYLQRLEDQRPQPIRRAAEPGRNDACPCGSGKKYKKCCGDVARLH